MLIINADDFGANTAATDNALACYKNGRITSASAMVFMSDSERAAGLALENDLDVGLHLNFTHKFNGPVKSARLIEYQMDIARFLQRNKYCLLLYNPFLRKQFAYVYNAQYDEFMRLYGKRPTHIDGHHHMHLCTNMLIDRYVPTGFKIRRSFSFSVREKSPINRLYRNIVDRILARRYSCTDFFFSISPDRGYDRLRRIVELSHYHIVELMTHPEKRDDFVFLMSGEYSEMIRNAKTGIF